MKLRVRSVDYEDNPEHLVEMVYEDIIEGDLYLMLHPGDIIEVPFAGRGTTLNGAPIHWGPKPA